MIDSGSLQEFTGPFNPSDTNIKYVVVKKEKLVGQKDGSGEVDYFLEGTKDGLVIATDLGPLLAMSAHFCCHSRELFTWPIAFDPVR